MGRQVAGIFMLAVFSVAAGISLLMVISRSSERYFIMSRSLYELPNPAVLRGPPAGSLSKELENEQKRKIASKETIAEYKRKFGKDYTAVLAQDLEEYKRERGLDAFRKKFGYDLNEYESFRNEHDFLNEEDIGDEGAREPYGDLPEAESGFGWGRE